MLWVLHVKLSIQPWQIIKAPEKENSLFVILFRLQWTRCQSSLSLQVMCSWMSSPMQRLWNWSSFEIVQPLVSCMCLLKHLLWQFTIYSLNGKLSVVISSAQLDWLVPVYLLKTDYFLWMLIVEVHIKMHRTKFLQEVFSLLFVYDVLSHIFKKKIHNIFLKYSFWLYCDLNLMLIHNCSYCCLIILSVKAG